MTNLKSKIAAMGVAGAMGLSLFGGSAFAAAPTNPGCFGTDRAAYVHDVALTSDTEPGASEVGAILGDRGAGNGQMNRDYMTSCGGTATP